ncbi:MAG TPA: hypothetical protein GXX30_06680 [Firmicutes bacterium]|nr:hypothetical protein [Candidatus Fermentithermobacillaceae bacterium]
MATRRLYWENPYDAEFSARVVRTWREGNEVFVVLDSTLFYPEGGGQPSDTGIIVPETEAGKSEGKTGGLSRGFPVSFVREEDGEIVHVVNIPRDGSAGVFPTELETGSSVRGAIDWKRRFDHMQQHTGQHILSRAFEKVAGASTRGFHLGKDYVSIDLDVQVLGDDLIRQAEDLANEVVFKDVPVEIVERPWDEIPPGVRVRLPVEEPVVRIVQIGDFDACACGGTHVSSTGQVGIIKINGTDRSHGGVRVIFRCGWRALRDLAEKERLLSETARILSQGESAVPGMVGSLLKKVSCLEKEIEKLKRDLLELEILKLAQEGNSSNEDPGKKAIIKIYPEKDPAELRVIARRVSDLTGKVTVVLSRGPRFGLVVAVPEAGESEKVSGHLQAEEDASAIVAKISQKWGGRGGGSRHLAQLGSKDPLKAGDNEVLAGLREILGLS